MRPRRVNVDRMRRYRERTRVRYVWTHEERQELLERMQGSLARWRVEDEQPYGYFPRPSFGDGLSDLRRSPKRCTVHTSAHDQHAWDEVGPVITSLHVCPGAPF